MSIINYNAASSAAPDTPPLAMRSAEREPVVKRWSVSALTLGIVGAFMILAGCPTDPAFIPSSLTISSPHIMGDSVTIARGDAATITVTNACTVLTDAVITIPDAPAGVQASGLPAFYDRTEHAPATPGDPFRVPGQIAVIAADGSVLATDYTVTVLFPECDAAAAFGSQTGADAANAYQIDNAAELELVSHLVVTDVSYRNKFYDLTRDIDLGEAGLPWSEAAAGAGFPPIAQFTGTFDCQGYQIANLYINRPNDNRIGLFGYINAGTVQNCSLVDVTVTGNNSVGSLVGFFEANSGLIDSSYVSGSVTGGQFVGGLVGSSSLGSTIRNSAAAVTVTARENVGGLIGDSITTIERSYATGAVTGTGRTVGGLAGSQAFFGVTDSYATGAVTGDNAVGGLIGNIDPNATTVNSYAIGAVTGAGSNIGGLIGANANMATITNSYWDAGTTGQSMSAAGTSRTTAQLQVAAPVPTGNDAVYVSWDTAVWQFTAGQYPRLKTVVCANRQYADPVPASCGALQ